MPSSSSSAGSVGSSAPSSSAPSSSSVSPKSSSSGYSSTTIGMEVLPSSSSSEAVTYGRGIRLRRLVQSRMVINVVDGFRFRVEAYGGHLMPNHIFRYLRRPLNPDTGTKIDELDGVCSPPDLEEFGEDAPLPDVTPPFLRLDFIDIVLRSQHEADEAWRVILEDVHSLVDTLNIMDHIVPAEDVAIGNPPPA